MGEEKTLEYGLSVGDKGLRLVRLDECETRVRE